LAGRSEAVKVDQGNSINNGVADLDHSLQAGQGFLIDLFMGEKFWIIKEVTQKSTELPHCFLRAVKAADNRLPSQTTGFKNSKPKNIERFCGVPVELGAVNPYQIDSIGNF
jgi:hypothetical protein